MCRVLPSSMQFKASPGDQIALEHFAATRAGERFRKLFDDNVAAAGAAAHSAHSARRTDAPAGGAEAGDAAVDFGVDVAGAADGPEEDTAGARQFRPLEWLRARRGDGPPGRKVAENAREEVQWPGNGSSAVDELPVFFVPGVSLSLPLQVCCDICSDPLASRLPAHNECVHLLVYLLLVIRSTGLSHRVTIPRRTSAAGVRYDTPAIASEASKTAVHVHCRTACWLNAK